MSSQLDIGLNRLRDAISSGESQEILLKMIDKHEGNFQSIFAAERSSASHLLGIITEGQEHADLLTHDEKTGFLNFVGFQLKLKEVASSFKNDKNKMGVLYIKIPCVNSNGGQNNNDINDKILNHIKAMFLSINGRIDMLGAFGDGEFGVIIPSYQKTLGVTGKKATNLFLRLSEEITLSNGGIIKFCPKIGASIYPIDASAPEIVFNYAKCACFGNENSSGVKFHDKDQDVRLKKRMFMIDKLKEAIEKELIEIYVQPQFEIETRKVVGVEVLARWFDKDLNPEGINFIRPDEFIKLAEEEGLIVDLDKMIMKKSMIFGKKLKDRSIDISVGVNISAEEFKQDYFVEFVIELSEKIGFDLSMLDLEITERIMIGNFEQCSFVINKLKEKGVKFSMDDFGQGQNTLKALRQLIVDVLKIDIAFLKDLQNEKSKAVLLIMLGIGKTLRLEVLQEGIETEDDLIFLKRSGFKKGQGYFLARPMSVDKFFEFIENR